MNPAPLQSPEQAESAFYAAFEAGDLDAMMAVWCDDENVVCVHPGGERHVGVAEVRESWRRIFAGSGRLRFRVAEPLHVGDGDLSVRAVIEYIAVAGIQGATPVVATNVFRRTGSGWRLWMHHASPHPLAEVEDTDDESEDDSGDEDDDGGGTAPTLH